jgi:hypothetical protein
VMQKRGNNDENLCQEKNYDIDDVCATQNCGKLRRTFVAIATCPLSLKKNKNTRDMVLPYCIVIWYYHITL